MKGIFVTGTDTDVGKTWVGSRLLTELKRENINLQVRKPIESGWPTTSDISSTDAWKLASAINQTNNLDAICPHRFSAAISPDRAAMLEGKKLALAQLHQDCLKEVNQTDFLYVEGAGGFYSPLCENGLNADLAESLQLPVLLVVENRLGCINQALLNVEAIASRNLILSAIILNNHVDCGLDKKMDNFSDIQSRVDCDVIALEYEDISLDPFQKIVRLIT